MKNVPAPEPRPLHWLRELGRRYPSAWKTLEEFRALRGSEPALTWPNWVYVPVAGAYAVVSQGGQLTATDPRVADISRVAALGAWRVTKGIYRFDPVLFDELWHSEYEGPITLEPLRHLPEWSIYVEVPELPIWQGKAVLRGFFAFLEYDMNHHNDELYLVWDLDEGGKKELIGTVLHLHHQTLEEALRAAVDEGIETLQALAPGDKPRIEEALGSPLEEAAERSLQLNKELAKRALSLVFYVIASRDVRPARPGQPDKPHRPRPTKTRKGQVKIPAAPGPRYWDVGVRFGGLLRTAYAKAGAGQGTGSSKRPHVRRAHWHGYWVGPRSDPEKRRLELRWLPPILVGMKGREGEVEEPPAVIWPVRPLQG